MSFLSSADQVNPLGKSSESSQPFFGLPPGSDMEYRTELVRLSRTPVCEVLAVVGERGLILFKQFGGVRNPLGLQCFRREEIDPSVIAVLPGRIANAIHLPSGDQLIVSTP